MAGSFGFEAGKYDVSQAVGERVLLPKIRATEDDTIVVADGFSCRTQIAQGTERHALHLAELMKMAIDAGPDGPPRGTKAEAQSVEQRRTALRRSMIGAALFLLVAVATLVAVLLVVLR
jgi:hypothetical protein